MTNQAFESAAITDEELLSANGGAGSDARFLTPDHQPVHVHSVHGLDGSTKLQNLTVNFG